MRQGPGGRPSEKTLVPTSNNIRTAISTRAANGVRFLAPHPGPACRGAKSNSELISGNPGNADNLHTFFTSRLRLASCPRVLLLNAGCWFAFKVHKPK